MHQEDLVSIITPSYNSQDFIQETINSVISQTHQNWEMIIVDDASSDGTPTLLKEISKKESRVKYHLLKNNSGPAVARNKAIELAQGKYLAFLDADDIWFPFHLTNSIATIKDKKVPFVFASYKRSNENLEFVYSDFVVPEKVTYSDILKTNSISCLTAFVNVSKLGKEKMPLIKKRQDMGLWLTYLKKIPYAHGIQECHAIYRIRENSLSRDKKKLIAFQWEFYRNVENLNIFQSIYYMLWWMYLGYKKYKN
ncbi:glycosyltransferase family 2 protein [Psychroflexus planctonicus]|uniref:Teichuronic acid biosynthesis glycosyltransferase TuaG n=1 Tax=Psychroflexus planctonicus TaxID=1526575 RepID=A0ABQ1SFD4_9FLAO|nr:glycosyltransferase family 2 protein [Psychroflexus planctonicus]GGE33689.1 putative teichuronic acid biosynthesis glycosyltransferase TuaG [Psychroflexus planctonicus]